MDRDNLLSFINKVAVADNAAKADFAEFFKAKANEVLRSGKLIEKHETETLKSVLESYDEREAGDHDSVAAPVPMPFTAGDNDTILVDGKVIGFAYLMKNRDILFVTRDRKDSRTFKTVAKFAAFIKDNFPSKETGGLNAQ